MSTPVGRELSLSKYLQIATISQIIVAVFVIFFVQLITKAIYRLWFHPLSNFPGPKISAFTHIPYLKARYTGQVHKYIAKAHREYGPIVRLIPNELSFIDPQAWKDVYGHGTKGSHMPEKDWKKYGVALNGVPNLIQNKEITDHTRVRRIFNPAFSDRALKQQEPLFMKYADKLVSTLKERIHDNPNTKVDLVRYYNFTTFDVMGDLTFGEPLHMLDNAEYDPWVKLIFRSVKYATKITLLVYYPILNKIFKPFMMMLFAKQRSTSFNYSVERVTKRLEKGRDVEGVDLWDLVLSQEQGKGLSRGEMDSNAALFMIAGTETTATLLSGMTYFLLKNPEKMKHLSDEIRGSFANSEDVSMEAIAGLPYLNACIKEALRLYPPVVTGFPRLSPPQGCIICGEYIPPGFTVAIPHFVMYTSEYNFKDPLEFVPERWLGDERFISDQRQALQPFSCGPRDCLGKNMAYHEMRLIMAKVIYNFELDLCPESDQWPDQEVYILWQKIPLMARLKAVQTL